MLDPKDDIFFCIVPSDSPQLEFEQFLSWLRTIVSTTEIFVLNTGARVQSTDHFYIPPEALVSSNGVVDLPQQRSKYKKVDLPLTVRRITPEMLTSV